MDQPKPISGMRATLLFLLYPLVGEFLFIDTIIKDKFARRRIRAIFTLLGLAIVAISFSASELIILITPSYVPPPFLSVPMRYLITGTAAFVFLVLFIDEGRRGRISLKEQIDVPEDRVSLLIHNSREVFITLNRILNAAQLQRYRSPERENIRLANYALTVLSEYLQTRIFSEDTDNQ